MSRDARGQMLLVAGLALAVAFVALALVLNTVVFTENLATRNHNVADDALGFERAVEGGVGGLIAEANRHDDSDYGSLDAALRGGVATWDENATRLSVAGGSVTATSVVGTVNGTRLHQDETQELTDRGGNGDWTVARAVDRTRRFVVVATPDDGGAVSVNVSDGTDTWQVEIADSGGDTTVTTYEDGTPVVSHTHGDQTVVVDLTEGTVNGTSIDDWTFARNVSTPYDVEFADGHEASGRYQLVVDRPRGPLLDDLGDPAWNDDGSYPVASPAIYSADVNVTVQHSSLTYQTTLTVAPEEGPWNETLAV